MFRFTSMIFTNYLHLEIVDPPQFEHHHNLEMIHRNNLTPQKMPKKSTSKNIESTFHKLMVRPVSKSFKSNLDTCIKSDLPLNSAIMGMEIVLFIDSEITYMDADEYSKILNEPEQSYARTQNEDLSIIYGRVQV
ncbi:hypothetical protein RF11_13005 [Thelohanellus kitauei]|uniref:Uncharacterized protein n=1 Tax=Thelohanellus kitauei TaxID=669202 RepID=A0A0C2J571_THEKT|nr:hypothetical protein RF11_13005 [Thelohanellus kitauei]